MIDIIVHEKHADPVGYPEIVCGNSDCVIRFVFDSEWDAFPTKTVRFVWDENGRAVYTDVLMNSDRVSVPVLRNVREVAVGVYAGNLSTTTPARILCVPCITDGEPVHPQPEPDVYNQLMQYLADIQEANGIRHGIRIGSEVTLPEYTDAGFSANGIYLVQTANEIARTDAAACVRASAPCLLTVCVMHREPVQISGEGWTLAAESAVISSSSYDQQITVWTRPVSAGLQYVSVSAENSAILSMKAAAIYGAASLTAVDNQTVASVPFSPTAPTGKRRLYLLSSINTSSTGTPNAVTLQSDSGHTLLEAGSLRFSAFYDAQTQAGDAPAFSYFQPGGYAANSINVLTFDITEEA